MHIGTFVDQMEHRFDIKTTKLTLSALRAYFRYLVRNDALQRNPADDVRPSKHSYTRGETQAISAAEIRRILDSIPITSGDKPDMVGLRDRALIAMMAFTLARVGAVLKVDCNDLYSAPGHTRVKLAEKGGKDHDMPCHPVLCQYLDAYIAEMKTRDVYSNTLPLFRAFVWGPHQVITEERLSYQSAYAIVQKYAALAGLEVDISNHTFRASGITTYLNNGGTLEHAQRMANHSSPRTTQLYDRREDQVDFEEMERFKI